jgi:hypothetical protein
VVIRQNILIPFGICTFALGFGVAWMLNPATPAGGSESVAGGSSRHHLPGQPTAARSGRNGGYDAILSDRRQDRVSSEELDGVLYRLDPEAIPDLLADTAEHGSAEQHLEGLFRAPMRGSGG